MQLSYALTLALQLLAVDALTLPPITLPGVPKTRPQIHVGPKTLKTKLPKVSPPRHKTCHVMGGTADDSAAFLKALHSCNHGGHVVLDKGVIYTIGTVMDLTFLHSVDLGPYLSLKLCLQLLTVARYPGNANVHHGY